MNRKICFYLLLIGTLVFVLAGCTAGKSSVKLEPVVYRSEFGGFEYQYPVGYSISEDVGVVKMMAPGASEELGPLFLLMGYANDGISTSEDLLNQVKETWTFDAVSEAEEITIGGLSGYKISYSLNVSGEDTEGSIVVVAVSPAQLFIMLGGGPKDLWKTESKVFDTVLSSIKFFEPNLLAE